MMERRMNLYDHICTHCGISFAGGSVAKYCLDCKVIVRGEQLNETRRRRDARKRLEKNTHA